MTKPSLIKTARRQFSDEDMCRSPPRNEIYQAVDAATGALAEHVNALQARIDALEQREPPPADFWANEPDVRAKARPTNQPPIFPPQNASGDGC